MSIIASEIVLRKSAETSNAGSNGGRMSATAIVSGVKNNLFPDITQPERTAGVTLYRKCFLHIANDADLGLIAAKVFLTRPTPGDDLVVMFPGTQVDTQSGIGSPSPLYGCGKLNADALATATQVQVLVENWSLAPIFTVGGKIRISSRATVDDISGADEYLTIAGGGISVNGNIITLTTTTGLQNAYSASNSYVSSVYEHGTCVSSCTAPVVSGGGSYNNGTYPLLPDGIGSIEQDWTISFTSASQYTITGNTVGSLGTFNVSNDAAPSNPAFSKPYFTINRLGWSGTVLGTQMTFTTHPAAIPVWEKMIVPAGAASLTGDKAILACDGESA